MPIAPVSLGFSVSLRMPSDLPGLVEKPPPATLRFGDATSTSSKIFPSGAVSHPSTGHDSVVSPLPTVGKPSQFLMSGLLMHIFVSCRVATKGPTSNGLACRIADKIRSLSMEPRLELQIPRHA
jgi:hypothetical protein